MKEILFEVCANGVESAVAAQEGGADRVELCAGIPEGGTTPSAGTILVARQLLTRTRLHVIIRPRGGDFTYSEQEYDIMQHDIEMARQAGADGIVIGCLNADGTIDTHHCRQLMAEAGNMSITFHRAFDRCRDAHDALETLIDMGVDRVLTSGQQPTAEEGIGMLHSLHEQARGRIAILAGCGINEQNIARIRRETGVSEFHFSAREPLVSPCAYMHSGVYMGAKDADESVRMLTTKERVRRCIERLK